MEGEIINTLEDLGVSNANKVDWCAVSRCKKLSESFIERFSDKVDWDYISIFQRLSETFIEKHSDNVDWDAVSVYQKLSEPFLESFADKVDESLVDMVDWYAVSRYQKLSEPFIKRFSDKVVWCAVSRYQKLSESFIERFADKVDWNEISKYQPLSDEFIKRHSDKLCIPCIKDSWLYKSTEFKKKAVIDTGMYECHDDYFIAYKGIRSDRYSNFNFQYQYLPGETYETHADYSDDENSFGFSAWNYEDAKDYCSELVVKVKIYYEDVARVVHNGGKIRCSKMTVLN